MTPPTHDPRGHHHDSIAELLDLDGEVLHRYWSDVMAWVGTRVAERPTDRILDVGAGTGTGTIALADRFPGAHVVAADISPEMLQRVQHRAAHRGMAERVSTVQMNVDEGWPELGAFDVVWASAALHELADADAAFGNIFSVLNPSGLLAVVEMDGPPRFLDDSVGAGLEARIHDVLGQVRAGDNDHPDWSTNLEGAGFTAVETASFSIDIAIGADDADAESAGRYAQTYLRRIQPVVAGGLSASDRRMLDELIADDGPSSVRHRGDLHLRAGRTAWAGLRP